MLRGQPQRRSPKSLARAAGGPRGSRLEALEPRVLLSSPTDAPDIASIEWRGAEISVIEDSWLVTFDKTVERHEVQKETARVASQLGVLGWSSIEVIGSRFGMINVEGQRTVFSGPERITQDRVDELIPGMRQVTGIDPNAVYQSQRVPDDEFFGDQWYHENVGQFGGYAK